MTWQVVTLIVALLATAILSRIVAAWENVTRMRAELTRDQMAAATGQMRIIHETVRGAREDPSDEL